MWTEYLQILKIVIIIWYDVTCMKPSLAMRQTPEPLFLDTLSWSTWHQTHVQLRFCVGYVCKIILKVPWQHQVGSPPSGPLCFEKDRWVMPDDSSVARRSQGEKQSALSCRSSQVKMFLFFLSNWFIWHSIDNSVQMKAIWKVFTSAQSFTHTQETKAYYYYLQIKSKCSLRSLFLFPYWTTVYSWV